MTYLDALRSAVDALRANPMRSILTTLGVIIGVAAVILVVAIGSGARDLVVSRIKSLGSNLLVLEPGAVTAGGVHMPAAGAHLTEDDVLALAHEVPGVQLAVPIIRGGVQAVHGASNWPTALYGVGPGFLAARDWQLAEGRGFEDEDEEAGRNVALLGQTVAARLFGAESPIGHSIRVQGAVLTVLGVLSPKGQTTSGKDQDDTIVVPLRTAKARILGRGGNRWAAVDTSLVKIEEGYDLHATEQQVRLLLRDRHRLTPGQEDDFSVENLADVLQIKEASTRAFATLVTAIASVSLLVGGIGIMNIMLVSVLERVREIGIRMAVGARQADILTQFLIEAAALSLTGGAIGIAIGVSGAVVTAWLADWPVVISPESIAMAIGCCLAVGLGFGFYPARRAAALDPIEALRRD
ncbi:MAG: ABC transporter permease [Geminicoccaceae bacterium]